MHRTSRRKLCFACWVWIYGSGIRFFFSNWGSVSHTSRSWSSSKRGRWITNGGSTIAENCIKKETFDNIQKIIEKDREALKAIEELWGTFKDDINRNEVKNGVKAGFQFASMINTCGQTGYKLGVAVGKTASITGSEAVFRGLSSLGKVVHIGGFAVSAALLPLDIYNLVQNAKKVDASRNGKSDQEPNEVKVLKDLADKLAEEIPDENEIEEMIENLIKMRKPSAPMEVM